MKANDVVSHKKFGCGSVISVDGSTITVAFKDGDRRINERFLEVVESALAEVVNSFASKPKEHTASARIFRIREGETVRTWAYVVCRWVWPSCPVGCDSYLEDGKCGHQRPFPIPYVVRLMTDSSGNVVRASCAQGRKGEKGPCDDEKSMCDHVQRAMAKMEGQEPDRKSPIGRLSCEFRTVTVNSGSMPKCPNCHSRAFVRIHEERFSCSSGTCMRPDSFGKETPFVFSPGDGRLKPRWKFLEVKEGFHWK